MNATTPMAALALADVQDPAAADELAAVWDEVRQRLDNDLNQGDPEALQRLIETNALSAQQALFGGAVQLVDTGLQNRSLAPVRTAGGTTVSVAWWGVTFAIPKPDLDAVISTLGGVQVLIDALTPIVPPVVRPFLGLLRMFLDLSKAVLRALDRGRGVNIVITFVPPGLVIPMSR